MNNTSNLLLIKIIFILSYGYPLILKLYPSRFKITLTRQRRLRCGTTATFLLRVTLWAVKEFTKL